MDVQVNRATKGFCLEQDLCLKPQMAVDPGSHRRTEGTQLLLEAPTVLYLSSNYPISPMPQGGAAPTFLWYSLRLWRLADFRDNEGIFALTAGEHDMVAGVAQVGVGLA